MEIFSYSPSLTPPKQYQIIWIFHQTCMVLSFEVCWKKHHSGIQEYLGPWHSSKILFFVFVFVFVFFFRPPFEFLWVRRIFKILKINSWNYTQRLPFGAWGIFSYFQRTTFSKKSSNDLKFSATLRKLPTSVSPPFAHF